MTIATCYLSPEGVILGADSTTTYLSPNGPQYYNHAQKVFEIGDGGNLGIVTWGLGGLGPVSYRKLFADFDDDLKKTGYSNVGDATQKWIDVFWAAYDNSDFLKLFRRLSQKPNRTAEEEQTYVGLRHDLVVGFCLGGHAMPDRSPAASVVIFDPVQGKPTATPIPLGSFQFWGAPNMIKRLIFGYDDNLRQSLINSGKWSGTEAELDAVLATNGLSHNLLPLRDAIDIVHACILSTIKALKFSNLSQICGGPIEIAVISADRPFRWVRHKGWDSAIEEGTP